MKHIVTIRVPVLFALTVEAANADAAEDIALDRIGDEGCGAFEAVDEDVDGAEVVSVERDVEQETGT